MNDPVEIRTISGVGTDDRLVSIRFSTGFSRCFGATVGSEGLGGAGGEVTCGSRSSVFSTTRGGSYLIGSTERDVG